MSAPKFDSARYRHRSYRDDGSKHVKKLLIPGKFEKKVLENPQCWPGDPTFVGSHCVGFEEKN
jgi:hypothetical protein